MISPATAMRASSLPSAGNGTSRSEATASPCLPDASSNVNPMLTIMAVADHAVRSIGGFEPDPEIEEGPAFDARQRTARVFA